MFCYGIFALVVVVVQRWQQQQLAVAVVEAFVQYVIDAVCCMMVKQFLEQCFCHLLRSLHLDLSTFVVLTLFGFRLAFGVSSE